MTELRIATRRSPLALWQAEHVRDRLAACHPEVRVTLLPMTTEGDRRLSGALATVGGKGLFVKELETAMLEGRADLAVHSMKDVPAQLPDALCLTACLPGEDPRDALVSRHPGGLDGLPQGARVGTASLRRQAQLARLRPDVEIVMVRGNVGTRLGRLDGGELDAILLAHAGLHRLGLAGRISHSFDPERFVPAIGQGIIGIECRSDDTTTRALLEALHDPAAATRLEAERALGSRLGGACTVPVAGHAVMVRDRLRLTGLVAAPDGSASVRDFIDGDPAEAATLGAALAESLLAAGGRRILADLGVRL